MARNLDMTALRSFVAVADMGGVTKASGFLHLTQSAVSMQLKRLEESLGLSLLDRSQRTISLTASGEQLLGYARRMLELNDEALQRLTHDDFEGEIILGVPHDIVYPVIPRVLQMFHAEYPRMRVSLVTSHTDTLKADFSRGIGDLILTTEYECDPGGETLITVPLRWVGAPDGSAYRQRPLRLAFGRLCRFRSVGLRTLEDNGIPWEMAVDTESDRTIEATVSADLAVGAMLEGTVPPYLEPIPQGNGLPHLEEQQINLYGDREGVDQARRRLADMVRQGYDTMSAPIALKFG